MNSSSIEYHPMAPLDGHAMPFSEAVRVGDLLYLAGQLGNVPGTLRLVAGGIAPETRQMMENIRAILERHGSSLDRVIKCTVFLADMHEWTEFNATYRQYFGRQLPARSALGANGLALAARVEMECIAVVAPRVETEG
jgi:reactive intermediate/imine deaminase